MRGLIPFVVPAITLALGIPLALGTIGPNPWYGFRTAKAFASREAWDRLNKQAGVVMIVGGIVAVVINLVIAALGRSWKPEYLLSACALIDPIPVLIGLLLVNRRANER